MSRDIWEDGDATLAVCQSCSAMVPATYCVRDVPFDDGGGVVPGILVAVCDGCDEVIAIPAQSTPAIKIAREKFLKIRVEIPAVSSTNNIA